jgi:hypothetical protein
MKHPIRELKRIISQFFETEYWYRWRKWDYYYFDDEIGKYVKNGKCVARDYLTCTWDGEGDILGMMRLKIEHMYYNLKKYGNQADFYLDSYNVLEKGTENDKALCLSWILNEYDLKKEEDLCHYVTRREFGNGNFANLFPYKYEENCTKYLAHEYVKGKPDHWSLVTKEKDEGYIYKELNDEIVDNINVNTAEGKEIAEGIIREFHSVNVPVIEYNKLSKELKPCVRGLRRVLTELLYCRHLVKKLYEIDDTNDKYFNMWKDIEDEELRSQKLRESMELYKKDRYELYHRLADLMAEHGRGWWD